MQKPSSGEEEHAALGTFQQDRATPDSAARITEGVTDVGLPESDDAPYPGLRSFRRDETHIFFGREGTINEMVDRLAAHRFLAVTGASGSGKSSLVRTGLLDALGRGLLGEAGPDWRVADFAPGDRPLARLTQALAAALGRNFTQDEIAIIDSRLARGPQGLVDWLDEIKFPPDSNILLLTDQFEEIFRYRRATQATKSSRSSPCCFLARRSESDASLSSLRCVPIFLASAPASWGWRRRSTTANF